METWHPEAIKVQPVNTSAGYFKGSEPFRQVAHSTEVMRYSPSTRDYYGHQSYPHATIHWDGIRAKIYQHFPINRAARALKNLSGGVETNAMHVVQFEIAWVAAEAPWMPVALLDAIRSWCWWVSRQTGSLMVPVDSFHTYPPENGHRLGSEPWRMSHAEWRVFNGICGHMHVPENVHGDPGKIDINYICAPSSPTEVHMAGYLPNADEIPGGLQHLVNLGLTKPTANVPFVAVKADGGVDVFNNTPNNEGGLWKGDLPRKYGIELGAGHLVIGWRFLRSNTGDYIGYRLFAEDGGVFDFT